MRSRSRSGSRISTPVARSNSRIGGKAMNRFCEQCGNALLPGAGFCQRCGKPVSQGTAQAAASSPPPPQASVPPPSMPAGYAPVNLPPADSATAAKVASVQIAGHCISAHSGGRAQRSWRASFTLATAWGKRQPMLPRPSRKPLPAQTEHSTIRCRICWPTMHLGTTFPHSLRAPPWLHARPFLFLTSSQRAFP